MFVICRKKSFFSVASSRPKIGKHLFVNLIIVCGCAHIWMSHLVEWCALARCIHTVACLTAAPHQPISEGRTHKRLSVILFETFYEVVQYNTLPKRTYDWIYPRFCFTSICMYCGVLKLSQMNDWIRDACSIKNIHERICAILILGKVEIILYKRVDRW